MEHASQSHDRSPRLAANNVIRILFAGACVGALAFGVSADGGAFREQHPPFQEQYTVHHQVDLLDQDRLALPGATPEDSDQNNPLRITGLDRRIAEQDGSGDQANPPVALYAAHLSEVRGPFSIAATLENIPGASLQFYSNPPEVFDEFLVIPASVRITVGTDSLKVERWDGRTPTNVADQKPDQTAVFPIEDAEKIRLRMIRNDDTLTVRANGRTLGGVPENGIFTSGSVWFGADAPLGTSWELSALSARRDSRQSHMAVTNASSLHVSEKRTDGLQQLANRKRPGFLIGSAASLGPLVSDSTYQKLYLDGNLGQITFENALKWQNVEPQPGIFSFAESDALLAIAKRHGMQVNGHAAGAFGEALPLWLRTMPTETPSDKQAIRDVLTTHISTIGTHFKDAIDSFDIINEPLADYDTFDPEAGNIYRENIWYKALGESYIAESFHAAHTAMPQAKLWWNDFGLEADDDRWNATYSAVKELVAQGVPIYGVGFEAHVYNITTDAFNAETFRSRVQQLKAIGLHAKISEQDVDDSNGQAVQAEQFRAGLQACLAESTCESYSMWGLYDKYDRYKEPRDGGEYSLEAGSDLLYDDNGHETPAVAALRKVLTQ